MDGRRFDEIARSLAADHSRRDVLRAIFGFGSGMLLGGPIDRVDAARRPTPVPETPSCPGEQIWDPLSSSCMCSAGEQCGPDCCPVDAQCCDNECCYGTCYGEELCCQSPREWCPVSGECCADGWKCCADSGCRPADWCCTDADCPGAVCQVGVCDTNDGTCGLAFDCMQGDENSCCPNEGCNAGICQTDGSCASVFDCTVQDGNTCCSGGENCEGDGTCISPSIGIEFRRQGEYCATHIELYGFPPNTEYWASIVFQDTPDVDISQVTTNANGRTSTGGISLWPSGSTAAKAHLSYTLNDAMNGDFFFDSAVWVPLVC